MADLKTKSLKRTFFQDVVSILEEELKKKQVMIVKKTLPKKTTEEVSPIDITVCRLGMAPSMDTSLTKDFTVDYRFRIGYKNSNKRKQYEECNLNRLVAEGGDISLVRWLEETVNEIVILVKEKRISLSRPKRVIPVDKIVYELVRRTMTRRNYIFELHETVNNYYNIFNKVNQKVVGRIKVLSDIGSNESTKLNIYKLRFKINIGDNLKLEMNVLHPDEKEIIKQARNLRKIIMNNLKENA